jgi:hypothetical protein
MALRNPGRDASTFVRAEVRNLLPVVLRIERGGHSLFLKFVKESVGMHSTSVDLHPYDAQTECGRPARYLCRGNTFGVCDVDK